VVEMCGEKSVHCWQLVRYLYPTEWVEKQPLREAMTTEYCISLRLKAFSRIVVITFSIVPRDALGGPSLNVRTADHSAEAWLGSSKSCELSLIGCRQHRTCGEISW
jgi:hypothetical protein